MNKQKHEHSIIILNAVFHFHMYLIKVCEYPTRASTKADRAVAKNYRYITFKRLSNINIFFTKIGYKGLKYGYKPFFSHQTEK